MAQIGLLVTELKRYLKAQGVTYASLAKQLDLSESSVKRQFARQSFSLARGQLKSFRHRFTDCWFTDYESEFERRKERFAVCEP